MGKVYTDGSCSGNPGPGGWAFVTDDVTVSGHEPATTNNRMEMQAVIEALRSVRGDVEIVSDSRYVIDCLNQKWYVKWRANEWRRAKNKPVLNRDVWEELLACVESRRSKGDTVVFTWVKGHGSDPGNQRADAAARAAATTRPTKKHIVHNSKTDDISEHPTSAGAACKRLQGADQTRAGRPTMGKSQSESDREGAGPPPMVSRIHEAEKGIEAEEGIETKAGCLKVTEVVPETPHKGFVRRG